MDSSTPRLDCARRQWHFGFPLGAVPRWGLPMIAGIVLFVASSSAVRAQSLPEVRLRYEFEQQRRQLQYHFQQQRQRANFEYRAMLDRLRLEQQQLAHHCGPDKSLAVQSIAARRREITDGHHWRLRQLARERQDSLRALNQSYDRARQRIVTYQRQTTPIYSEHWPPDGLLPGWSRIPLRY